MFTNYTKEVFYNKEVKVIGLFQNYGQEGVKLIHAEDSHEIVIMKIMFNVKHVIVKTMTNVGMKVYCSTKVSKEAAHVVVNFVEGHLNENIPFDQIQIYVWFVSVVDNDFVSNIHNIGIYKKKTH